MSEANDQALAAWQARGGVRPSKRPDGWPTRADVQWMTPAEKKIRAAMLAVEEAGGSPALTAAINLLSAANDRVADHVEGRTA